MKLDKKYYQAQINNSILVFSNLPIEQKSILWNIYISSKCAYNKYNQNIIGLFNNKYIEKIYDVNNTESIYSLNIQIYSFLDSVNQSEYKKLYENLSSHEIEVIDMFFTITNGTYYHPVISYEMNQAISFLQKKSILEFNIIKYQDIKLTGRFIKAIESLKNEKIQRSEIVLNKLKVVLEDPSPEAMKKQKALNQARKRASI